MGGIAFGIASHKNQDQVVDLINLLHRVDDASVFLHHDAHSPPLNLAGVVTPRRLIEVPRRRTYWGTFHLVEVFLDIIGRAHAFDHLVFLSGQDLPVAPPDRFRAVLAEGDYQIDHDPEVDRPGSPVAARYQRRWHFKPGSSNVARVARKAEKLLPVSVRITRSGTHWSFRKTVNLLPVYKGNAWFSVNADSMNYILDTVQRRPELIDWFRHTLIPDEGFFATLLGNSKTLERGGGAARFMHYGGRSGPRLVTAADIPSIEAKGAITARKFDAVEAPDDYQLFRERAERLMR